MDTEVMKPLDTRDERELVMEKRIFLFFFMNYLFYSESYKNINFFQCSADPSLRPYGLDQYN